MVLVRFPPDALRGLSNLQPECLSLSVLEFVVPHLRLNSVITTTSYYMTIYPLHVVQWYSLVNISWLITKENEIHPNSNEMKRFNSTDFTNTKITLLKRNWKKRKQKVMLEIQHNKTWNEPWFTDQETHKSVTSNYKPPDWHKHLRPVYKIHSNIFIIKHWRWNCNKDVSFSLS